MDEQESLTVAKQQSYALQHFLDDLYRVWLDAAAREMRGRFLDVQRREDESMLHAFEVQSTLLGKMRAWLSSADIHIQNMRVAQKNREAHLAYVQRAVEEVARERKEAMQEIKKANDSLSRMLQLIQAAKAANQ